MPGRLRMASTNDAASVASSWSHRPFSSSIGAASRGDGLSLLEGPEAGRLMRSRYSDAHGPWRPTTYSSCSPPCARRCCAAASDLGHGQAVHRQLRSSGRGQLERSGGARIQRPVSCAGSADRAHHAGAHRAALRGQSRHRASCLVSRAKHSQPRPRSRIHLAPTALIRAAQPDRAPTRTRSQQRSVMRPRRPPRAVRVHHAYECPRCGRGGSGHAGRIRPTTRRSGC